MPLLRNEVPVYRPEIDGLRAVAVVVVILFHSGLTQFSGGFIGVDVFFVISGYLITSILARELASSSFSILRFYERRARRILPALVTVISACVPFAWLFMLPEDLKDYARSMLSAAAFFSNIHFWRSSDYFSPSSEEQPLLHTWSLAVEEQYYLLFPIFLALMWRLGNRGIYLVILGAVFCSIGLAEWGWRHAPSANFYLLPTRIWELLIGALVALFDESLKKQRSASSTMAGAVALCGLLVTVASSFLYNDQMPFPSLFTLVPVLGTALVIAYAAPSNLTGRLLSTKAFVSVGLISYSLYLWHQPVLAFARRTSPQLDSFWLVGCLVAVAFLSYLTWRYIETPFRRNDLLSRGQVFKLSAASLLSLSLVSTLFLVAEGFPSRGISIKMRDLIALRDEQGQGERFCKEKSIESELGPLVCKIGAGTEPIGVLWGDSFAGALLVALHEQLAHENASFLAVISDGCPPVPGLARPAHDCRVERHQSFLSAVSKRPDIKYVIWTGNFSGALRSSDVTVDGKPRSEALLTDKLRSTFHSLLNSGKFVSFVLPPPRMPENTANFYMKERIRGESRQLYGLRREHAMRESLIYSLSNEFSRSVFIADPADIFCEGGRCPAHKNSVGYLYSDDVHFSLAAARVVVANVLKGIVENRQEDKRRGDWFERSCHDIEGLSIRKTSD